MGVQAQAPLQQQDGLPGDQFDSQQDDQSGDQTENQSDTAQQKGLEDVPLGGGAPLVAADPPLGHGAVDWSLDPQLRWPHFPLSFPNEGQVRRQAVMQCRFGSDRGYASAVLTYQSRARYSICEAVSSMNSLMYNWAPCR